MASDALRHGRAGFADVRLSGEPVRLYAAPLPEDGGPAAGGAVLVASSTTDIEQTLHRLGLLLLLSRLLAAGGGRRRRGGCSRAAAWARCGACPRPRAEIERTGDASRRLPDPRGDDEVADLAARAQRHARRARRRALRERRFLADASHELRTPVTSLAGNVEFLARHGVNPEVLADLQLDTARLQRLVGDLLTLERESAGRRPSSRSAWTRSWPTRWPAATPRASSACTPVTVRGEPDALRRALDNLLDNAEIHGPRGGEVSVSLTRRRGRRALAVRDEGPGLDPGDLEHAFERFWRAPEAAGRPGTGLGLAIVRATAERHGGRVTVDRSTVTVILPT